MKQRKKMTKVDLIEAVSNEWECSKAQAAQIVELFFDTIKETLSRGEEVKISGFGVWSTRDKRTRMGRNPRTGEPIPIAARRVVKFRAGNILKMKINARIRV